MTKFDLTWGESVCVRQAFVDTVGRQEVKFDKYTLMGMGYPKHEGNEKVVEITRQVIERQTGLKPKHVFLTNGATGAVVVALRAYFQHGFAYGVTPQPPYFALYPSMVQNSGLIHCHPDTVGSRVQKDAVYLLDSPSNPRGEPVMDPPFPMPVVWDAVYHNNVYAKVRAHNGPEHDVMCGSYSKLTGVNGLRVGWVATDDDVLAKTIGQVITAEYVGLSYADSELLISLLDSFNWDHFEATARGNLDDNKDEWYKIRKYFRSEVPANGMFHYTEIDTSTKYLLQKAGVGYMPGSKLGTSDQFARFNLGQDRTVVKEAVKAILRNEHIFKL